MPAILRSFEITYSHDDEFDRGIVTRHRDGEMNKRVRIELDADDEFVDKLNAFFREQVRGSTRPIPGPRLEERATSDRSDAGPPRLPPGPIEGEFVDDVLPKTPPTWTDGQRAAFERGFNRQRRGR